MYCTGLNPWPWQYWYRLFITTLVYLEVQHDDQLPVGLLAQLAEHCTGIPKVMSSNHTQAWIVFRPYFHYCSSSVCYCGDCFSIHLFIYCLLVQGQRLMCRLYIDWKEIQLLENAWIIFCLILQCYLCF